MNIPVRWNNPADICPCQPFLCEHCIQYWTAICSGGTSHDCESTGSKFYSYNGICLRHSFSFRCCYRELSELHLIIINMVHSSSLISLLHLQGRTNPSLSLTILGLCALIAAVLCLFLPETLGEDLPNTLEDGESFGSKQSFWNCPVCSG